MKFGLPKIISYRNPATKNTSDGEMIGGDNGDKEKSSSVLVLKNSVVVNESESFNG